jgi:two-component system cell cycle sensor histidine kinase/response regulator CckA
MGLLNFHATRLLSVEMPAVLAETTSITVGIDWLHVVLLLAVPVVLLLWGQYQPRTLRRLAWVLVGFLLGLETAGAVWLYSSQQWVGLPRLAGQLIAVGLAAAATLVLLRKLPGLVFAERFNRPPDLERLRLLEAAVAASPDGVMIAEEHPLEDGRLHIVYANPAFAQMTGYAIEEALGQSPSILPDEETEPDALKTFRNALRSSKPVRVEVQSKRKNGSKLWTEWQIVPIGSGSPEATLRVAILRDTTERRRTEQAIRENEARWRGLFEQAADAIFVLSPDGRIVDVNRRACESLGYTWEELTSRKLSDIDARVRSVDLRPGDTATTSGLYRRKDGTTYPVEVRLALIDVGGSYRTLAMVRDVTRRRATEQALRERENLLRNLIAHIPCGVFWKDRNSVYLGCNQLVASDHGLISPEAVVGLTDFDLYQQASEAEFYRECDRKVIESGEPMWNIEQVMTRADGTKVLLLANKVPLRDASGAVIGVLGVYQDVTERKRLEEQLRQSQKMEAIGRLAGGVAHDFNNLLTIILGNTHLLRAAAPPDEEAIGLIDEIREAADRAAGLVRQLLTFSRRTPAHPEIVDLNQIVASTASLLRRLLGEQITVHTRLAPDPVRVRADRGQLEQVVMNLAVNARDAMPNGGTLTISTRRIDPPSLGEDPIARLTVTDTGIGMTDEVKARIFEPFFTTKGPDKGTGLGLATVYGIVEQSGGHIEVDTAPGKGTTFRVDLPWCFAAAPSTVITARETMFRTTPGGGKSVLLVEDEDGVRKLARFALEGQGYTVAEAPDAESALELLKPDRTFDLLVTDLTMPGMDGRDLAGRVRATRPEVGVVFVSGYVPDGGRLEEIPGAIFLPKPFTPVELLRAAGRAMPRR